MTQEDLNEVMGKSLANYQLRQLAEDGGKLDSALTLIDRLESELLNAQEHAQNLEFLLNQKDEKISQLEAKATAYDRLMSGGKKTMKELANILGRAVVVDASGNIESFAGEPIIDLHYGFWYLNEDDEDYEDDIFLIPRDIVDYTGDWKDSLTLPDGWED